MYEYLAVLAAFGLVYSTVAEAIERTDLVFHCNYLGGDLPNFALNFTRPGNQVVAQYYNFLRPGHEGYREVHQAEDGWGFHH